jgi:hypothetical protein
VVTTADHVRLWELGRIRLRLKTMGLDWDESFVPDRARIAAAAAGI